MIRALLVALVLALSACSSQEEADFKQAQKSISQGHFRIALGYLDQVIKRNASSKYPLEAAREAARLSFFEIKDFKKAIAYHHYIVLNSTDEKERLESQRQIASIYFNNLQDYQASIIEFSKLQQMPHTDLEAAQYKMNIARAQYYLNNFFQAESEIDSLLKLKSDDNIRFSAMMLKGNILVAKKDFKNAAVIFKDLIDHYPDKAVQENVALTLAVCYEENFDFKSAIAVLEEHRGKYNPPEYIELRIKRLQERMRNAPGAKGFRK
ncbi:tetratricopeptide repeat protein [Bdellovibrio bacteriovorus]|uniref:tetratricopeptide repeat protein n=1 Tax=Bdellovibrio bacteriovorus TaxID=959 RepID=UPI0021D02711|nr:tetratricopeptide repeat protein [Bdellovibrio bacteriovorus]UXR65733.1 tetratricopeptide repeat protein [Bdellovibrio bacteriovorus]